MKTVREVFEILFFYGTESKQADVSPDEKRLLLPKDTHNAKRFTSS